MRDFKFLKAVVAEKCAMCWEKIQQGDGFYYETTKKEPHCRDCGRAIREKGYNEAMNGRNVMMKIARQAMGDRSF